MRAISTDEEVLRICQQTGLRLRFHRDPSRRSLVHPEDLRPALTKPNA